MKVWMVIQAYNEEKRPPAYLQEITAYFEGRGERYEVVVDDGSQDGTGAVLESLQGTHPALRLVRCHAIATRGVR